MSDLQRLRDVAEAATPGPWEHAGQGLIKQEPGDDGLGYGIAEVMTPKDAPFVATFDPVVVSALLDVAEDAHQMFRAWDDDAISRADQDAAYHELAASFERLREVIEANAVLARANLRLTYGV